MRPCAPLACLLLASCFWQDLGSSSQVTPSSCSAACCEIAEQGVIAGAALPTTQFGYALAANHTHLAVSDQSATIRVYGSGTQPAMLFQVAAMRPAGFALSASALYSFQAGLNVDVGCHLLQPGGSACAVPTWSEPLQPPDTRSRYFGKYLAADSRSLLIADPDEGNNLEGQVYIADPAAPQLTRLRDSGLCPNCKFGAALALSAERVAVRQLSEVSFSTRPSFTSWSPVQLEAGCALSSIDIDPDLPEQSLALADQALLLAVTCGMNALRIYDLVAPAAFTLQLDAPFLADLNRSNKLALSASGSLAAIGATVTTGAGAAWAVALDHSSRSIVRQLRLVPAANAPMPSARYGQSIAVSGPRIFVGDPDADGGKGAVHIFACATP